MKRIAISLLAALALCVLASCNHTPNTPELPPQDSKTEVYNYTNGIGRLGTLTSQNKEGQSKMVLDMQNDRTTVVLKEWVWDAEQNKLSDKPFVYKGRLTEKFYDRLVDETSIRIEKTRTQCFELNFKSIEAPEGTSDDIVAAYRNNLEEYSGMFDVEYVSGYKIDNRGWAKNGGYERYWTSGTVVDFTMTLSKDAPKNSMLIGTWILK